MANNGVILGPGGVARSAWTWHAKEPCPFTMSLEPGATVVHLDDALTADELATLTRQLVESPEIAEALVKERLAVPADVRADVGETLAYKPGGQRVVSRGSDRETVVHDFKARPAR